MKQTICCPMCGNPIEIEVNNGGTITIVNHNHATDCGISNPNLSTRQRARLEALVVASASGNLPGRFFAMENGGSACIATIRNGVATPVSENELDSVERSLYVNGYVRNTRLFRRFVLAQMMTALSHRKGFNDWVIRKGYRYSWRMAVEELRVLNILRTSDPESYSERKRFFTRGVIVQMADEYIAKLERTIEKAIVRHHKGKAYKRIGSRSVYVSDIESSLLKPLRQAYDKLKTCSDAALYVAAKLFFSRIPVFMQDIKTSTTFLDAYKGEGAYYALKNLIMFHGCNVHDEGRTLTMYESLDYINKTADKFMPQGRGYVILGLLKRVIEDNNFDYAARMKQLGV